MRRKKREVKLPFYVHCAKEGNAHVKRMHRVKNIE